MIDLPGAKDADVTPLGGQAPSALATHAHSRADINSLLINGTLRFAPRRWSGVRYERLCLAMTMAGRRVMCTDVQAENEGLPRPSITYPPRRSRPPR